MNRGQLEQRLLVLITLGLVAFGLVMVYSATSAAAALGNGDPVTFLKRQGVYALIELPVAAKDPFAVYWVEKGHRQHTEEISRGTFKFDEEGHSVWGVDTNGIDESIAFFGAASQPYRI